MLLPSLGLVIGLRNYTVVSPVFDRLLHNYPASALFAFLLLAGATWLGLRFVRKVLVKLVDWSRLEYLDIFLGGIFGLTKGLAVVWLGLTTLLVIFPQSASVLGRSPASVRVLALAERVVDTRALLHSGVERLMSRTAEQVEGVREIVHAGAQLGRSLDLLRGDAR